MKRSPIALGLGGACVFLGAIGLVRAIAEFGRSGFVAFLGVLFGPAILVASAIFVGPHFNNGLLGGLLPSTSSFKRLAYGVVMGGAVGAAFTGIFGVGWLLNP